MVGMTLIHISLTDTGLGYKQMEYRTCKPLTMLYLASLTAGKRALRLRRCEVYY